MNSKRGRRSNKKPVLTSPGKVGAFVSLLLVFVSIGVGYYLLTFYKVQPEWLKAGSNGWGIDLRGFVDQMYPLLAAVAVISLLGYFLIASAVKRYQYYLDSGQDYRKMISLAESIDDLTDPAQIARLSSYPELQAVLRNYGDQIREISREIGQKEENLDYAEFDGVVDALLDGASADGKSGGKAWESTYRKIRDRLERDRSRIHALETSGNADRAVIGRATLAYSRVMEAISGAGEDLLEITKGVSDLRSAAGETDDSAPAPSDGGEKQRRGLKAIVAEMENSVRKLEEGAHVLGEFSEENNGIALNMAIMAAKGSVGEHDLATFAEKVRGTAERFRRLNGTVTSIAQGLLGYCHALKDKVGAAAPAARERGPRADRRLLETARVLEERSNLLQGRICALGSELHEVHELLQHDFTNAGAGENKAPEDAARTETAAPAETERAESAPVEEVSAPRESDGAEPASFVIDHGKSWDGMGTAESNAEEPLLQREKALSFEEEDDEAAEGSSGSPEEEPKTDKTNFSDMSSLRDLEQPAEASPTDEAPPDGARHDGSWMEMPGHRWLKINVEKSGQTEARAVEVTVEGAPEKSPERAEAEACAPEAGDASAHVADDEGDEPVYDLFHLGAVEYVEEAQTRR